MSKKNAYNIFVINFNMFCGCELRLGERLYLKYNNIFPLWHAKGSFEFRHSTRNYTKSGLQSV